MVVDGLGVAAPLGVPVTTFDATVHPDTAISAPRTANDLNLAACTFQLWRPDRGAQALMRCPKARSCSQDCTPYRRCSGVLLRPRFLIALVAIVVSAVSLIGLRAARASVDRHDLSTVRNVAAKVGIPSAATISRDCHGDGLVSCWSVTGQAKAIAAEMQGLVTAAGGTATATCDALPFGTSSGSVLRDECQVTYRQRGHAVAVFINPAPGTNYLVAVTVG